MNKKKKNIQLYLALVGAAGVAVFSHWLALASLGEPIFKHLTLAVDWKSTLNVLAPLFFFTFSFMLVFWNRKAFMAWSFRYHPCKPRKCLIIVLTLPKPAPQSGALPWEVTKRGKTVTLNGKSLLADIESLTPTQWNWQQLLRALVPHHDTLHDTLKEIRLIGSPDWEEEREIENSPDKKTEIVKKRGSKFYAPAAKELINTYFPEVKVQTEPEAVDFEDFNAMVNIIGDTLKELLNTYSEEEINIDITGGQKTASIAAAAVTINSKVHFQYVRTGEYKKEKSAEDVMSYDVRVVLPLSSEN